MKRKIEKANINVLNREIETNSLLHEEEEKEKKRLKTIFNEKVKMTCARVPHTEHKMQIN